MSYRAGDLRNLDWNLNYYIASGLSALGYTIYRNYTFPLTTSGIYLVDGNPDNYENIKLPTVAITFENLGTGPYQLGPGKSKDYRFSIDIYGKNKGQKEDLSERVFDMVDLISVPLYDYNEVFESATYTQIGYAEFAETFMYPVRDAINTTTKYQNRIICTATLYISTGSSLV